MSHPNVLPLLGVTVTPLQLVSNWMSGGDLPDYLRKNPGADRLGLVRVPSVVPIPRLPRCQLSDVTSGLHHLHSCNVIHGDLKGVCSCVISFTALLTPGQPNVLVDHSGNALIADFGLATVTQNMDSIQSATHQAGHTPRWAAPEVLLEGTFSKEADIFAFAMVMIEVHRSQTSTARVALTNCRVVSIQVFIGAIPFSDKPPTLAILNITQGRRPSRPTHPTFTAELWTLMERCWNQNPHLRPEVSEVLTDLRGA